MDNARPEYPVNTGERAAAVIQKRIDQRMLHVSGSRMDNHSLRLVYYQKILILI